MRDGVRADAAAFPRRFGPLAEAALPVGPPPYAPAAGRDGLRLGFTHEVSAGDLGPGRVAPIGSGNIPDVLDSHAPSRRLLRDVGLVDAPPVRLGGVGADVDLLVDADDGRVHGWYRDDEAGGLLYG
ncbi:hypothetical protein [Embleya scabrispora]|uniref:hypothetical protein n=1 Tax=Embleya scabrispora TaxID=159449 RepID=UPI001374E363|nr:hypothetical protein [Embleya scabrispora]